MTRRPNIELFQHGAAHSRKASAGPHWENESSGYSVIWSSGGLAKFIRHPTTAIGQLTFGSRDRPVSRVSNRQVSDRARSCGEMFEKDLCFWMHEYESWPHSAPGLE